MAAYPLIRPSFVPPMLATRVAQLPEGAEWEYEVKWDGYRIEAVKNGATVHLFSWRGADYSDKFKPVTKAVREIRAESAVLDGEVIAIDAHGQPSFQVLQNRGKMPPGYQLVFYVFDLLIPERESLDEPAFGGTQGRAARGYGRVTHPVLFAAGRERRGGNESCAPAQPGRGRRQAEVFHLPGRAAEPGLAEAAAQAQAGICHRRLPARRRAEDALTQVTNDWRKPWPWTRFVGTECWAALVDNDGWGLGVFKDDGCEFNGGIYGDERSDDPKHGSTAYVAPIHVENFDYNIVYEHRTEFVVGRLADIRKRCNAMATKTPPAWRLTNDRQHWTMRNVTDQGFPMRGEWRIKFGAAGLAIEPLIQPGTQAEMAIKSIVLSAAGK